MSPARGGAAAGSRACGVCGVPAPAPYRTPPPELAPDLDLRPGEPTRSTLLRWVATCRGCGAAAPDLAVLPAAARAVVERDAYRAHRGPAAPFLRWAMLCDSDSERAEALLQAAWATEDAGHDAAPLRLDAAAAWNAAAPGGATLQDGLRLLDALRRGGDLAGAAAQAASLAARPLDETDRALLDYQRALIAAGDRDRHLLSSALRPPAQRPHVTHGRAPAPPPSAPSSFWKRLVGR